MSKIVEYTGDLFTSQADALGHGVNVKGAMGAGIALQFKNRFPDMYEEYAGFCAGGAMIPGDVYVYYGDPIVFNIASQDFPGPNARPSWLAIGLGNMYSEIIDRNVSSVALPQIGCGIGGLDWKDVKGLITDYANYYGIKTELWTYGN